jgi:hypothetical protein
MHICRFVMSYATLVSALSACNMLAPTPRQTFGATQTMQAPVGDRKVSASGALSCGNP